jgi:universal stress protein A
MKWERILIAINDSEPATWAVETAVNLATQLGSRVTLLHVVNRARAFVDNIENPSAELLAELRRAGQALLEQTARRIPGKLAVETILREGKPADEIVAAASEAQAQLVVLGTHGRSRLSHLLLGSTAEAVVRQCPCAVLTVGNKPSNGNGAAKLAATASKSTTTTTR